tara:strand:- start:1716 stop:1832 length:117 start_codon:yes stop_codon:yes gene_type:complete
MSQNNLGAIFFKGKVRKFETNRENDEEAFSTKPFHYMY